MCTILPYYAATGVLLLTSSLHRNTKNTSKPHKGLFLGRHGTSDTTELTILPCVCPTLSFSLPLLQVDIKDTMFFVKNSRARKQRIISFLKEMCSYYKTENQDNPREKSERRNQYPSHIYHSPQLAIKKLEVSSETYFHKSFQINHLSTLFSAHMRVFLAPHVFKTTNSFLETSTDTPLWDVQMEYSLGSIGGG